jgi:hypothetical protein
MRAFSSWRFGRSASLLTTGVLLCLGVFLLWWPASGSDVSTAFPIADAPHVEQSANGNGDPIDDNYLAVFANESEAGNKLPKNAALLRALVYVLFFGLALEWIMVSGWRRRRPEVCSLIRCWFHSMVHLHQRRAVATLLGVFRL